MTYYFIYIEAWFCPEVLERILRVIRHRGFVLYSLNVLPCGNYLISRYKLHIYITLVGERSINVLCGHLNKLVDVSCVFVQNSSKE